MTVMHEIVRSTNRFIHEIERGSRCSYTRQRVTPKFIYEIDGATNRVIHKIERQSNWFKS